MLMIAEMWQLSLKKGPWKNRYKTTTDDYPLLTISSMCHISLINTTTTSSPLITYHNCIVLAYQLQTCCTQPPRLEIRPFTPGLAGFPCQIFIEAETLDGHHQTYSSLSLSLSTREDEPAAAAAEQFQRSALEYNLLYRIDEWQENVLPFTNFDALKANKWTWAFSGSERGVGRGDLSDEYWVLFQIIHHVVIRYSTKATLSFLSFSQSKSKWVRRQG